MYKYEDQKEMRSAINGKMIVMVVGLFLIVTAITGTLLQAFQYVYVANAARTGMEDAIKAIQETGLQLSQVFGLGVVYAIAGIVEVGAGIICLKFSNRLDKLKLCLYADIVLFVVMLLQQVYNMIIMQAINPFGILSALVMPAFLLWALTRLMKLAKKYPDRKFAVEPNPARTQRKQVQPQNKNLMARAKAQPQNEEIVSKVVDEISPDSVEAADEPELAEEAEAADEADIPEDAETADEPELAEEAEAADEPELTEDAETADEPEATKEAEAADETHWQTLTKYSTEQRINGRSGSSGRN
jgi:hypothetical protein